MDFEKKILPDYLGILNGNKIAKCNQCKSIKVIFDRDDGIDVLWKKHDEALDVVHISEVPPKKTLLEGNQKKRSF